MSKSLVVRGGGLAGVLLLAGTLFAEQPGLPGDGARATPQLPPDVRAFLDALDDERFVERQKATSALSNASVLGDDMLVGVLKTSDLSLEQRTRLMSILKDRFERSERAAIGIEFNQGVMRPCIAGLRPKFPAAIEGILRVGDVFLEVDGISLEKASSRTYSQHNELIGLISSFKPGDLVAIKIFRPKNPPAALGMNGQLERLVDDLGEGETLELMVPMGRRADLDSNPERVELRENRLRTAWRYMVSRIGLNAAGTPIEVEGGDLVIAQGGRRGISTNVLMTSGPMAVGEHEGVRPFAVSSHDVLRRQQIRIMNNVQLRPGQRLQVFASDGNQIRLPSEFASAMIIPETPGSPDSGPPGSPDAVGDLLGRLERLRVEIQEADGRARSAASPADRSAHEQSIKRLCDECVEVESELNALMSRTTAGTASD